MTVFFRIEEFEDLAPVCFCVRIDRLTGKLGTRCGLSRRITDQAGEVADEKNRDVAQFLEGAELTDHDRVPEMDVGRGRIGAEFHAQRFACFGRLLQLLAQLSFTNDLDCSFAEVREFFVYRYLCHISDCRTGIPACHRQTRMSVQRFGPIE